MSALPYFISLNQGRPMRQFVEETIIESHHYKRCFNKKIRLKPLTFIPLSPIIGTSVEQSVVPYNGELSFMDILIF
jgi:hypothetical protein